MDDPVTVDTMLWIILVVQSIALGLALFGAVWQLWFIRQITPRKEN